MEVRSLRDQDRQRVRNRLGNANIHEYGKNEAEHALLRSLHSEGRGGNGEEAYMLEQRNYNNSYDNRNPAKSIHMNALNNIDVPHNGASVNNLQGQANKMLQRFAPGAMKRK
jgi:hypothetical protein